MDLDNNQPGVVKDFDIERHLFLTVKGFDEENPNVVHATVSTDEVDRYGEIVQPDSIRAALPAFLANPVVLPAHQHRLENGEPPVIGRVLTDTIRVSEHSIDLDIEFDDDDLGQKYARKYRRKMMRAFSIGFRGLEGEYKDVSKQKVWIWTAIELLEVSAVAVPANRGALARALGYYENDRSGGGTGELIERLLAELAELKLGVNQCKSALEGIRSGFADDLEEIKTLLTPDQDGLGREFVLGDERSRSDPAGDPIAELFERIETLCI